MRYLIPITLLATLGCYSPRALGDAGQWPGQYGANSPDGYVGERLEARLWYDEVTGMATFDVNRQAHVALFALRPGASVEMIYPSIRYGRVNQLFHGGSHWVRTAGSPHRFAGNWSTVHGSGPIYIIMIASDEPLRVTPFLHTGRPSYMHRASMLFSPYVAVQALAEEIVPVHGSGEWTSAIHVVWPRDSYRGSGIGQDYVRVRCPSGVVLTVPADAWFRGYVACPNDAVPTPPDTTGADTTTIRGNLPQRPTPPGWMSTLAGEDGEMPRVRSVVDSITGERRRGVRGQPAGARFGPPGEAEVTPLRPPRIVYRPGTPSRIGDDRPATRVRPAVPSTRTRPATRGGDDRPAARPEARPRPTRPEARPQPSRPEARPAPRPQPRPRPAPPAKPKPKPDPDNDPAA